MILIVIIKYFIYLLKSVPKLSGINVYQRVLLRNNTGIPNNIYKLILADLIYTK